MRPQVPRRLVILTEGQFGPHSGKTAFGVIRYGRDDVVAVLDSTLAGRNVGEWIPGRDVPIVGDARRGAGRPRPGAPRRAADRDRADRRPTPRRVARGPPRGDRCRPGAPLRAPHVPRRRPGALRGRRHRRRPDRRLPPPAGALRDRPRAPPRRRQAGHPDGGHRLRDRQDVGGARASQRRPDGRRSRCLRPHGTDRDDDRRLGGLRRPRDQRLPQRDRGVARRRGRAARRLGPRGRPGVARPPGLQRRDARPHPRRDAPRDDPGPPRRPGRARLRSPAGALVPARRPARLHRPPRADRRDSWRHRGSSPSP